MFYFDASSSSSSVFTDVLLVPLLLVPPLLLEDRYLLVLVCLLGLLFPSRPAVREEVLFRTAALSLFAKGFFFSSFLSGSDRISLSRDTGIEGSESPL